MADTLVRVERDGAVATVWLDNPPVNAVSVRMRHALHAALDGIEAEAAIRCVILAGTGEKAFCAGADLREEKDLRDPAASRAFRELGRRTLSRIESFPKPVVAAIHGWCIGGGTALGWACDIRVAAENAKFRAGDAYLGVIPSWGMGLLRLPRLVGRAQALDILLLGEDFGAQRAYELGLVTRVVPRAGLGEEAMAIARRIASASPTAILATRKAINYGLRHGWDEMAAYEEELTAVVFAHPDAEEGMTAFLEKRRPVFQDETASLEGKGP
jgi:enoyl-CoA hydratase/carnithine racemase